MGHCAAYPTDFAGCSASRPGFALSRAASSGAKGLDRFRVEHLQQQSPGQILFAYQGRPQPVGRGAGRMGAPLGCHCPGFTAKLKSPPGVNGERPCYGYFEPSLPDKSAKNVSSMTNWPFTWNGKSSRTSP